MGTVVAEICEVYRTPLHPLCGFARINRVTPITRSFP
jgi:hypothetical protein